MSKFEFEIRGYFYADTPLRVRDRLDRIIDIVERTVMQWDGGVTGHQVALPGKLQEDPPSEVEAVVTEIITGHDGKMTFVTEVSK